eukprot:TRINITY_DN17484_c0_g1_i1.p1 TRINITY_DN17484_c0_g1~~TRINITY_DN17484_c0_g1_i1.p1  ORF type:complete len:595 (+),score=115.56 TRINITY_DN17484_c0_g1_i1:77-1861(+)
MPGDPDMAESPASADPGGEAAPRRGRRDTMPAPLAPASPSSRAASGLAPPALETSPIWYSPGRRALPHGQHFDAASPVLASGSDVNAASMRSGWSLQSTLVMSGTARRLRNLAQSGGLQLFAASAPERRSPSAARRSHSLPRARSSNAAPPPRPDASGWSVRSHSASTCGAAGPLPTAASWDGMRPLQSSTFGASQMRREETRPQDPLASPAPGLPQLGQFSRQQSSPAGRQSTTGTDLLAHTFRRSVHMPDADSNWAEGYEVRGCVGIGGLATVFLGRHKETGSEVALKRVPMAKLGQDSRHQLQMEVKALRALRHPNIIGIFGECASVHYHTIAIEYAAGGDLARYLKRHGGQLREVQARRFFRPIAAALAYCHSRGVCHRDVKPLNVLLVTDGGSSGQLVPKLCDFGLCALQAPGQRAPGSPGSGLRAPRSPPRAAQRSDALSLSGISRAPSAISVAWVGTGDYMAPEVCHDDFSFAGTQQPRYDGFAADVWSAGQMLHELLCGRTAAPPEEDEGPMDISPAAPALAADLLRAMLQIPPARRITMPAAETHRWMTAAASDSRSSSPMGASQSMSSRNVGSTPAEQPAMSSP